LSSICFASNRVIENARLVRLTGLGRVGELAREVPDLWAEEGYSFTGIKEEKRENKRKEYARVE
jgi:hypothetical protein